jgi:hypothetical protein
MCGDEQFPFTARSTLCDDASHRMACATCRFRAGVGRVSVFDHPTLDFESAGAKLCRRNALMIAEIPHDGAGRRRIERDIVERDHPAHRHFPSFGRLSLERQALHDAGRIAKMTLAARLDGRAIEDRESSRRVARRSASGSATATATGARASAATTTALSVGRAHRGDYRRN